MIVLDTHVLVWSVEGHPRLGVAAGSRIEGTRRTDRVGVSAMTLTASGRMSLYLWSTIWVRMVAWPLMYRIHQGHDMRASHRAHRK